uniref:TAXi_C domain-containing protein n=1 Tax=Echinostoma caproni TaxID=27848 RepID=A0A183A0W0_9TREM
LMRLLLTTVSDPTDKRKKVAHQYFLFAVDHCFAVTGQGTVMTGTVLAGTTRVGDVSLSPLSSFFFSRKHFLSPLGDRLVD